MAVQESWIAALRSQRRPTSRDDKPTADVVLVLNHKRAAEHLWVNRALTVANVCALHGLLTDDHHIDEVLESDHFLPEHQHGKPRELEDVNKADYIRGMAAFYELGSMHVIEQTFIQGYAQSVVRSSLIPTSLRTTGFDVKAVAQSLTDFINTGKRPSDARALIFLSGT